MHPDWLRPEGLPSQVGAVMTTREGGCSRLPWDHMNLGAQVGDEPGAVASNRRAFAESIGAAPVFLEQLHGSRVVRVSRGDSASGAVPHRADASVTTEPGVACTVLVADCLPLLFAAPEGRAVAAAHAGWRGLAEGIVEAALGSLCEVSGCTPADVRVWLGACIGPRRFEVGADVLHAFGADLARPDRRRFAPRGDGLEGKWLADLSLLAQDRLSAAGVHAVSGGAWCTVSEASRFFSYRRDGVTGRMAAAIWIRR